MRYIRYTRNVKLLVYSFILVYIFNICVLHNYKQIIEKDEEFLLDKLLVTWVKKIDY